MKKESPPFFAMHGTTVPSNRIICFVAAHSGGHIIPCLTLAQKEYHKDHCSVLFFTSNKSLDYTIIKQSNIPLHHVVLTIGQQRSWYRLPILGCSLVWAFLKSFIYLMIYRPERIVTSGSIVAIPLCIAGWLLNIPIELFELNVRPGKTMKFLSYFAETFRYCFTQTRTYTTHNHCVETPYPIRFTKRTIPDKPLPMFDPHRIILFIQGGSQGSHQINMLIHNLLAENPSLCKQIQVIHHAGAQTEMMRNTYAKAGIPAHVFSYDHNIASYYALADLVICRSGAGALFESLHFKKLCITIPLITPSNNHQLHNAQAMVAQHPELFHIAFSVTDMLKVLKTISFPNI